MSQLDGAALKDRTDDMEDNEVEAMGPKKMSDN
jgi:hypothetical protein